MSTRISAEPLHTNTFSVFTPAYWAIACAHCFRIQALYQFTPTLSTKPLIASFTLGEGPNRFSLRSNLSLSGPGAS